MFVFCAILIFPLFVFIYRKTECNADQELNRIFKILASQENDIVRKRTITHLGRDLKFNKTCGQVLDSTFGELCDQVRWTIIAKSCILITSKNNFIRSFAHQQSRFGVH